MKKGTIRLFNEGRKKEQRSRVGTLSHCRGEKMELLLKCNPKIRLDLSMKTMLEGG